MGRCSVRRGNPAVTVWKKKLSRWSLQHVCTDDWVQFIKTCIVALVWAARLIKPTCDHQLSKQLLKMILNNEFWEQSVGWEKEERYSGTKKSDKKCFLLDFPWWRRSSERKLGYKYEHSVQCRPSGSLQGQKCNKSRQIRFCCSICWVLWKEVLRPENKSCKFVLN